jgi:hypothetical protein
MTLFWSPPEIQINKLHLQVAILSTDLNAAERNWTGTTKRNGMKPAYPDDLYHIIIIVVIIIVVMTIVIIIIIVIIIVILLLLYYYCCYYIILIYT